MPIRLTNLSSTALPADLLWRTLEYGIFSLSLMGTNIEDYIPGAHRLLKLDGRLKVAEPAGHWEGSKREILVTMLALVGFELVGTILERGSVIYIDALRS